MGCQYRLGTLQMRVTRENDSLLSRRRIDKSLLKRGNANNNTIKRVTCPQLHCGGNLIVAAAARMEFPASVAQLADQGDFYVGVDVFKVAAPRHATFVDLRANGIECVYQCD